MPFVDMRAGFGAGNPLHARNPRPRTIGPSGPKPTASAGDTHARGSLSCLCDLGVSAVSVPWPARRQSAPQMEPFHTPNKAPEFASEIHL